MPYYRFFSGSCSFSSLRYKQSSQTASLNVISLQLGTNIARISFFPIQVTCPQMWFNYTNNAKYIQLLEYFLVIKNIDKIDPSLLNSSIRQNKYSLEWPHSTTYIIIFKTLFQRAFCQMKIDENKSEYTCPWNFNSSSVTWTILVTTTQAILCYVPHDYNQFKASTSYAAENVQ
jgi:hypothetical protein